MGVVFFIMGGIALIWSAVRSYIVYRSIVDSFPPKFQDDLSSRYAFSVLVLYPPTPLPLQAEYLKCLWVACAGFLCISLGFFSARNVVFGCFILIGFLITLFGTIKSWKTYKENCIRAPTQDVERES